MIAPLVRTELLNRLDEKEKSSVAFRLQDEKEKRLLLQNDVDIIMLKIGQMERSLQELKQSKGNMLNNFNFQNIRIARNSFFT